ncbi:MULTISPECIES: hypothetical protein [Burkholderia]|uniref:hypothetical protein n=1 Tax=Burkholderia TaxID=32008 RepID=UPI0011AF585B|nr:MULTISPECIES: hypothetical protein [unclassified Burkholderia]
MASDRAIAAQIPLSRVFSGRRRRTAHTGPHQSPCEAEPVQAALSPANGDAQSFAAAIARDGQKNLAPDRQIGNRSIVASPSAARASPSGPSPHAPHANNRIHHPFRIGAIEQQSKIIFHTKPAVLIQFLFLFNATKKHSTHPL